MKTITEMLPVAEKSIGEELKKTVNARKLHKWLGVGKDFSTWINDRIQKYGFEEGEDFIVIDSPNLGNQKTGRGGDRRTIEYHITTDMAKELAMVENNEKGREARRYFIGIEKAFRQKMERPSVDDVLDAALRMREQMKLQSQIIAAVMPGNLHLYGTESSDGKIYRGLRRGCVTKALHRLKDAAELNLQICQLELRLANL
jgi:phage anti-repressor protein